MHGRKITVAAVMLLASAFIALPDAAIAQARPATNLETTTLLSPETAWTYYGTDTTHTSGVGHTALRAPEIKALARGLGAERVGQPEATGGITADEFAQRVYDYVRNNIAVEFRFGLSKGARGALIDQSGTPFDQVHMMIELLREGGVTAGYRVGTVSMTAQEFGQWTGLIKGLVEQTSTVPQSFTVDAKAACQLLADGSIPGIVDSATACASLSGDLSATGSVVTLGHIWVSANGKFYDPSYKKHLFKEGIDLPAAMGCGTEVAPTCGDSATTAAMTGSSASTIGGSPAITNVNEAGLNSNLATKASALQNYVQANMVNGVTMDVVGGKEVDRSFSPVPSATTLFPSTTQYSWADEVPDQFRTKLRTRYAVFDQTFYGDEIAGKRIRILGYPQGTNPAWLLYLDSLRINTAACGTCSTTQVTLNIDHPYAAAAGLYSDEQVDMPLLASVTPNVPPITIVHGLGAAGPSTEQFYADLQKVDPHPVFYPNGYPKPGAPPDPMCGGSYVYDGSYYQRLELCRNDAQPTLIAKLLAQAGVAERITAEMGDAVVQRHHTIGMVASQATAPNSSDLLSVQSNISVSSRLGDASARMATFETTSAAWAMLEGSIAQQISDTWMPDSATSLIVMANRNSVPLINVTSAGMTALIPSLVGYNVNGRQTRLQQAATDGYNAIIPRNATPGAFSIGGVSFNWLIGGDLFYKANSVAYMINEAYKGGAAADGSEDPDEAVLNSAKAADYALNPKKFLTVSPASGEVTLDPRADLVTGAGSQSLALQRSYRSNNGTFESMALVYGTTGGPSAYYRRFWTYSGPDTDVPGRVGSGWMHNFGVSARMGNNAMKAMSEDSALDSSAFVAGLFTLQDAVRNPTFQRRLTGIFTAQWLNDRFIRNAVTVDAAGKIEVFGKLPNGTYNPPPASASRLIQNGAPIGPRLLDAAIPLVTIILR